MFHDTYLCLVESNKQQIEEVKSKTQAENSERQLPCESGFVLCIAPPSFSRGRRIKIKKSLNLKDAGMKENRTKVRKWTRDNRDGVKFVGELVKNKSNLHYTRGIKPKRVMSGGARLSSWTTQLRRNIAAVASG